MDLEMAKFKPKLAGTVQDYADVASDWFWEMGPDLRFTYMSERVEDVVGVPVAFHMGKTREELAGDLTSTEKWKRHLQDLKDHKPFRDFRYERKGPDGKIQYLSTSGKPMFNADGDFQGYIGIGSDLTGQLEMEERANVANERLATAIEALAEPFVLWDAADCLVICNQRFRDINEAIGEIVVPGVSYSAFARAMVDHNLIPEAIGREEEWLTERIEQHRNPLGSFEQQRHSGAWFMIYEQRLHDGNMVTISADITELKAAEARLRESQERLRDFANAAADWFWEQDENLLFTNVSEENISITGIRQEDHYGKTRRETGLLDVTEEQLFAHEQQLLAREPFTDFRFSRIRPDGTQVFISVSGRPVFDADDKFLGYRGAGRDITPLVEADKIIRQERDRAEAASNAKSDFLANMSHELRTPLNSIIGYSQILVGEFIGKLGNSKYIEYSKDIQASGEHLLKLINDILDISKVEAGEFEIDEAEFDVLQNIDAALMLVKLRSLSKNQNLEVHVPADLPRLQADERLIRQILINLLSNAIKFTPDGGRVVIGANLDDQGRVVQWVEDSGIGIAAADIKKVLEPFGQIRPTPELTHEGTGLGLSLSKNLIELHGGTLLIESEINKGTTVTLTFPPERTVAASRYAQS
jgi:PAS domain S-box-containing protein